MQSNILSAAAIGLCLAAIAPLSAQVSEPQEEPSAPRVLMVIREQIKEGREAAQPFDQPTPVDAINSALVDEMFYSPWKG